MRISDLILMGLRNLSRRKARTILTVLGVVIGSLSIIIMISIGKAMKSNLSKQLLQQGNVTSITVMTNGYSKDGEPINTGLKLDDNLINQIKDIKHVKAVSPIIQTYVELSSGKYQGGTSIIAMDSSTFEDFDFPKLSLGQYPNEDDPSWIVFGGNQPDMYDPKSRNYMPIQLDFTKDKIVLRFTNYMPDPKKKEFKLPLTNIARIESTNGQYDWSSYMDINYFKQIYLKYCNTLALADRKQAISLIKEYQQILLNVDTAENVEKVQEKIKDWGYQTFSSMEWIQPLIDSSKTIQLILGVLGAVSMVVSAITIANTMVMSIYERTKEIGIMKVLGCMVKDVKKLFLFEAGMIGLIGGTIGIILGYLASWLVNKYGAPIFKALMSSPIIMQEQQVTKYSIIPFWLPLVSMAISVGIAVISGYLPARRATKIKSIEAMKSEG